MFHIVVCKSGVAVRAGCCVASRSPFVRLMFEEVFGAFRVLYGCDFFLRGMEGCRWLMHGEKLGAFIFSFGNPSRVRASLDAFTSTVEEGCGIASNLGGTCAIGAVDGRAPPGIAELGAEVWWATPTSTAPGLSGVWLRSGSCSSTCPSFRTRNASGTG